eukprot:EG_transcript_6491
MTCDAVIAVQRAFYHYEYKDGSKSVGLHDCSVVIERGARVVMMGANGSGKSTLLGAIAGMHKCSAGKVTVLGSDAFSDCSLQQRVARIGQAWPDNANWCETVRQTAATYPGVDWDRFAALCRLLHVNPEWRVDHCSSGMKRKIQVLLGLIYPKEILCLDEFSADLDVVEREHILNYLKEASETHQVTVLYATHIFDNLADWPTHLLHMAQGRVVEVVPLAAAKGSLQSVAYHWILADSPAQRRSHTEFRYPAAPLAGPIAIATHNLFCRVGKANQGKFSTAVTVLDKTSLQVPQGARCLLVGTNGSGKSSLLRVLAGRHYTAEGMATVHGRDAYHDTRLCDTVGHSLDWWQATEWDLSVADVVDNCELDERGEELLKILEVDLRWRMNRVSSGQRKRIQLLINLLRFKAVLMLDEVTADLDVVQREEFLKFLHRESAIRGATIVYTTHIFEGLDGWPTEIIFLNSQTRNVDHVHYMKEGECVLQVVEEVLFGLKTAEWEALGIAGSKYTRLGQQLAQQQDSSATAAPMER